MKPDTAAALEQAAYSLGVEADQSERRAARLREEADAFTARAAGHRQAAELMRRAAREGELRLRIRAERYPRRDPQAGQLTGWWMWSVVARGDSDLRNCLAPTWEDALDQGLEALAATRRASEQFAG